MTGILWRQVVSVTRMFHREFHRSNSRSSLKELRKRRPDPRSRRVVVTGFGSISPLGSENSELFNNVSRGKSAISTLSSETFDYEKAGVFYAGQISSQNKNLCTEMAKKDERLKSPAMKYAEFAAFKAIEDVIDQFNLKNCLKIICRS